MGFCQFVHLHPVSRNVGQFVGGGGEGSERGRRGGGIVDYTAKVELTSLSSALSVARMMKAVAMAPPNMKGTARKLSHVSRPAPDIPWPLK